ncbi:mannosyltransferase [Sphingomonas sp. So64.6b]|uniref:mannosyltransferase n=1 Tax=Sphingomonas sp. So64.6b TaxID=2997354 RepID=UPI001FCEDBB4|nr:mannosyltransferase [Sphingomonas sp. So64.6b]
MPAIAHPDELWQYLEPAHYLTTGRWVRAWEYRAGIRSWLIPAVLAGPMGVGQFIAPGTMLPVLLPRLLCALGSLGVVWAWYRFGALVGRRHALIAGIVAAIWSELLFYGPRTLSEPISLSLFMPAAWLLIGKGADAGRRHIAVAGLLLGLAVCARLQMAPIVGTLAIVGGGRDVHRWVPMIVGGIAALAISAGVDLVSGEVPFRWMIENFRINLIEHKSAAFGVEPWYWYLTQTVRNWGIASIAIVTLALVGVRRQPVLLLLALVHLAAHSLIPHKEMRFILPTLALFVLLASLGSGDLLARVTRNASPRAGKWTTIGMIAAWAICSGIAAVSGTSQKLWQAHRTILLAIRVAGADPAACGLGFFSPKPPAPANYSFYGRQTPIYNFSGPAATAEAAPWRASFNVAIAPLAAGAALGPAYRLTYCAPGRKGAPMEFCVYRRAGGCPTAAPERFEINAIMESAGH